MGGYKNNSSSNAQNVAASETHMVRIHTSGAIILNGCCKAELLPNELQGVIDCDDSWTSACPRKHGEQL